MSCHGKYSCRQIAQILVATISSRSPGLMKLLAIRLSWQTTPAKSLVIRGNASGALRQAQDRHGNDATGCREKFNLAEFRSIYVR